MKVYSLAGVISIGLLLPVIKAYDYVIIGGGTGQVSRFLLPLIQYHIDGSAKWINSGWSALRRPFSLCGCY